MASSARVIEYRREINSKSMLYQRQGAVGPSVQVLELSTLRSEVYGFIRAATFTSLYKTHPVSLEVLSLVIPCW